MTNESRPKPTVLVVEDNDVLLRIAATQLRRYTIEVHTARNGSEAVKAVEKNSYSLILMDIHMPEMDGLEAARTIRSQEKDQGRRVPIVAITASESKDKCFAAGMDDYIAKPADYERVMERWLPDVKKTA